MAAGPALQSSQSGTLRSTVASSTLTGYGGAVGGRCVEICPEAVEELPHYLNRALVEGWSVGGRGAGRSYGDAAVNSHQLMLNLTRLNSILSFDQQTGLITTEPRVTIDQLWRHCISSGWWPAVVTGTARTTLGGCTAMNAHGKNAWHAGPIGEHITSLELLTATGESVRCSRTHNSDLFHAVVGGFGMLGIVTRLTLQLKPISSGLVELTEYAEPDLRAVFDRFESCSASADSMVAWLDAFATGAQLGRGHVQCSSYTAEPDRDSLSVSPRNSPHTWAKLFPVAGYGTC